MGWEVVGVCSAVGGKPVDLEGVRVVRARGAALDPVLRGAGLGGGRSDAPAIRELRGIYRTLRLLRLTLALWKAGRGLGPADVVHANDFDSLPAGRLLARALEEAARELCP